MEPTDEKSLIYHLQNREEDSFDLLYATYGRKIYHLAYRLTGEHKDAEDITQETFLRVYRHIDQFRGDSQLFTWIYAIAENLCRHVPKQKKKTSFASMEALLHSAQGDETTETFSEREKQIILGQIKDGCFTGLLRCLAFSQRMAFVLHVLLDLPMKDVADILGKSEGATKVLVHRARQNLKDFLCENCSLYQPGNPCRCENLMSFSLAKGWVTRPTSAQAGEPYAMTSKHIQAEVDGIRKVIALYQALPEQTPPDQLARQIRTLLQQEDWAIFSRQKV
jgi:RNA polymerase sigma factor (sigma-70 family)